MIDEHDPKADAAEIETREWIESLDEVLGREGAGRVCELFQQLSGFAQRKGIKLPFTANTPNINSIPLCVGRHALRGRLQSFLPWPDPGSQG